MPTVDTLVAQHLLKTVAAARLMGADCIISGIRPQIAQTIVHLGVDLATSSPRRRWPTRSRVALQRVGLTVVRVAPRRAEAGRGAHPDPQDGRRSCSSPSRSTCTTGWPLTLQDDLTDAHRRRRSARGVLIDISALEIVDSFIGRMLGNIAAMSRVLDAETVVVGMRPAVAITLVELGLSLTGVRTALNVERGMELLQVAAAQRRRDAGRGTDDRRPD